MTPPIVVLEGVERVFPTSPPVEALRGVDLTIEHGEYVSIVGASGSGKTTLMNVLGCLDRPTSGTYYFDGIDTAELTEGQRAALRADDLGFVFQSFHLLEHRTVVENATIGLLYRKTTAKGRRQLALEALERVGLGHRLEFTPRTLSGGERQRVAIARAIVGDAKLLFCDEPTGNLDSVTSGQILDLFDELRDGGLTLVVVTHDDSVSSRADRVIHMKDGQIQ